MSVLLTFGAVTIVSGLASSFRLFRLSSSRFASTGSLSIRAVLDRTDLSLDGLDGSLNAAVGVAVSDWAFFVHDFSWDMRSSFVFDVDDARFLVAVQNHFLMTCGQHVLCKRFFLRKRDSWPSKGTTLTKNALAFPSSPAKMVIGVPSSPMNM